MVLTIAAVGVSGSGKTTTLEYLISELSNEGYKVGAIKHIHREGFTIDKEGTNTWRFSKAGSKITVAISPEEIAIIEKTDHALKDFDKITQYLENEKLDVVFVEGFHDFISKRPEILKIITAKDPVGLEKTLKETIPPILAIAGLIAKKILKQVKSCIDLPGTKERLRYCQKPLKAS
jgi:molybdopterin-guanine dinucleotide biosynthesis protein B